VVSLNGWSASVAIYYVSVSGHLLSGKLHSFRMSVHSLSVSVSELFEYRRMSSQFGTVQLSSTSKSVSDILPYLRQLASAHEKFAV
jgi:hypothetical protein